MLSKTIARIAQFSKQQDGPTAVEYAILLSLIVIICVGAVKQMSNATADSFDRSAIAIDESMNSK